MKDFSDEQAQNILLYFGELYYNLNIIRLPFECMHEILRFFTAGDQFCKPRLISFGKVCPALNH